MFIIFHFGLNASGKSLLSSPKIQSMTVSLFFFIPPSLDPRLCGRLLAQSHVAGGESCSSFNHSPAASFGKAC